MALGRRADLPVGPAALLLGAGQCAGGRGCGAGRRAGRARRAGGGQRAGARAAPAAAPAARARARAARRCKDHPALTAVRPGEPARRLRTSRLTPTSPRPHPDTVSVLSPQSAVRTSQPAFRVLLTLTTDKRQLAFYDACST